MTYNIHFCILSFIYLSITAFFYLRQPKATDARSHVFGAMLLCGLFSIVMDIAAAIIDPFAATLAPWVIYAVNIVFLLSVQLTVLLFFSYTMVLTGLYQRLARFRAAILLPFAMVAVLLLISPFTRAGVFYLAQDHSYQHGTTHLALYAVTALYLLCGLAAVLLRRRALRRAKVFTVLGFLAVSFAAMLVQLTHPQLLVNSMANAFSLTLIYYVLESPSAHIDALTGALNRRALPGLLSDAYEQGQRCTLLLFPLKQFRLVNHSIGMKNGDLLLAALAEHLRRTYARGHVIRAAGDVFAVLRTDCGYIGEDALPAVRAALPDELTAGNVKIKPDVSIACVNSEDAADSAAMLALAEAVLERHRAETLEDTLIANGAFQDRARREAALESALERALKRGGVDVYYQPIHDAAGRLVSLEALVRIRDEEYGPLPTQEAVELAERKGLVEELGRQVLCRACELIATEATLLAGMDHIGVNLSALQCVRPDLPDTVREITARYGVGPELLAFEVTETAFASIELVNENMNRLTSVGFRFLLDDFGKGYSNFSHIATLPFHCVKIDKDILWDAMKSDEGMRFLVGVVHMLKTLRLQIVCEGVETKEQAELLAKLGVDMLQGYYFSKPLSAADIRQYIAKARAT